MSVNFCQDCEELHQPIRYMFEKEAMDKKTHVYCCHYYFKEKEQISSKRKMSIDKKDNKRHTI